MSDNYQAIFDAVRSRISNANIGDVVRDAIGLSFDISHSQSMVRDAIISAATSYDRPSAVYRPKLSRDGNQYCALYGDDLATGCCGFGDTADAAMWDFDKNWTQRKAGP